MFSCRKDKTQFSFTSSNSSFTECMRKSHSFSSFFSSSSLSLNEDCTAPVYKECSFTSSTQPPSLPTTASVSFTSCMFDTLVSAQNGAAIFFTSSHTLTIISSIFQNCSANVPAQSLYGGGAVCVEAGDLVARGNVIINCNAPYYAGGILAQNSCISSVISLCTFVLCRARFGGGLMTHFGPTSSVDSCRFVSCTGDVSGGGYYHNSDKDNSSISISNSLFANNCANDSDDGVANRGGGGFENYWQVKYLSSFYFIFFSGNIAKKGTGNDITVNIFSLRVNVF